MGTVGRGRGVGLGYDILLPSDAQAARQYYDYYYKDRYGDAQDADDENEIL